MLFLQLLTIAVVVYQLDTQNNSIRMDNVEDEGYEFNRKGAFLVLVLVLVTIPEK